MMQHRIGRVVLLAVVAATRAWHLQLGRGSAAEVGAGAIPLTRRILPFLRPRVPLRAESLQVAPRHPPRPPVRGHVQMGHRAAITMGDGGGARSASLDLDGVARYVLE